MGVLHDYLTSKLKAPSEKTKLTFDHERRILNHMIAMTIKLLKSNDVSMLNKLGADARLDLSSFLSGAHPDSDYHLFVDRIYDDYLSAISKNGLYVSTTKKNDSYDISKDDNDLLLSAFPIIGDLNWLGQGDDRMRSAHLNIKCALLSCERTANKVYLHKGFAKTLPNIVKSKFAKEPARVALMCALNPDRLNDFQSELSKSDRLYEALHLRLHDFSQQQYKFHADSRTINNIYWQAADLDSPISLMNHHDYFLSQINQTISLKVLAQNYINNCKYYAVPGEQGETAIRIGTAQNAISFAYSDTIIKRAYLERLDKLCFVINRQVERLSEKGSLQDIAALFKKVLCCESNQLRDYLSNKLTLPYNDKEKNSDSLKIAGAGLPLRNLTDLIVYLHNNLKNNDSDILYNALTQLPISSVCELIKNKRIKQDDIASFLDSSWIINIFEHQIASDRALIDYAALVYEASKKLIDHPHIIKKLKDCSGSMSFNMGYQLSREKVELFIEKYQATQLVDSTNRRIADAILNTDMTKVDTSFIKQQAV